MRILGKWSLAATLKLLVDVAYYLLLFFAGVILVILAIIPFVTKAELNTEIPVRFELDREAYSITAPQLGLEQAEIDKASGVLKVPGRTFGTVIEQVVAIIIGFGALLLILRRMRAILKTLKLGAPFVPVNVSRIRSIGVLIVALAILKPAVEAWWSYRVTSQLRATGIQFHTHTPDISSLAVFTGLILIVLAEVFRIGAEMKGDLEAARTIQFQLVPAPDFAEGNVRIHCHMRPANTVGGDYYEIIPLGEGRVGVVVGDVSGKGMPAALLMTMLQGSLRTLISAGFRGVPLIQKMNQYLVANTPENKMITLFFAELNTATGEMIYINAGHNAPLIVKADGGVHSLDSNSVVLGLLPQATIAADHARLDAGDRLVVYTDGLVEASNKREEEFGEARLRELAITRREAPAPKFQEDLYAKVLSFCRPRAPIDDMTLMIVEMPS